MGGSIGLIGVLHTWTRDLIYHPHVHYLVPGGGLTPDGQQWRVTRTDFLLPVKALSILFRARFRDALRKTDLFQQLPATIWAQPWVVHCLPKCATTASSARLNAIRCTRSASCYTYQRSSSQHRQAGPALTRTLQYYSVLLVARPCSWS